MAGKSAEYTHRHWTADMASIRAVFADRVAPAMEQMLTDLRRLDAGRTQIAMFTTALARVSDLGARADQILTAVGYAYDPVNEAQASAGGVAEVYGEKNAHQMG